MDGKGKISILSTWLHRRMLNEMGIVVLILLIVAGIWGFVEVADKVLGEEVPGIDEGFFYSFRATGDSAQPIRPSWLDVFMRDITALGGWAVLSLLTAAMAGYLYLQGRYHLLKLILVSTGGGAMLAVLLKAIFSRERPPFALHLMDSPSFPSAHSMMAAVVYPTLAVLIARIQPSLRIRVYIIALGLLIPFLVGFSRVYLGVHYVTDVVAGWCMGLAWTSVNGFLAWYLQKRGKIREEANGQGSTLV